MPITIRKAEVAELKTIQDLNYELFLYDYDRDPALNINWPYEAAGEKYFRDMISGEIGVCYVAVNAEEIVGYVAGSVNKTVKSSGTILRSELENIYILPDSRGLGAGKLLTEQFMQWCKQNGAASMIVTAYYYNEDAVQFYQACGMKPFAIKFEKRL